jgi:hypothetical protein
VATDKTMDCGSVDVTRREFTWNIRMLALSLLCLAFAHCAGRVSTEMRIQEVCGGK